MAIISRLVGQKGYDLIREVAGGIVQTGSTYRSRRRCKRYDFLQRWRDSAPRRHLQRLRTFGIESEARHQHVSNAITFSRLKSVACGTELHCARNRAWMTPCSMGRVTDLNLNNTMLGAA